MAAEWIATAIKVYQAIKAAKGAKKFRRQRKKAGKPYKIALAKSVTKGVAKSYLMKKATGKPTTWKAEFQSLGKSYTEPFKDLAVKLKKVKKLRIKPGYYDVDSDR